MSGARSLRGRLAVAVSRSWMLSARGVLVCLGAIALADFVIWRWQAPSAVDALFDEPAHVATGLLALAAIEVWSAASVVLAVIAGSLLIDLDHIPHLLGSNVLQENIPRPYTHSLGSIAVLVALALLLLRGNARRLLLLAALALALHFFRDMAEPQGVGVSLLWPVSDWAPTIGYGWYAGSLVALAAIALLRRQALSTRRSPIEAAASKR